MVYFHNASNATGSWSYGQRTDSTIDAAVKYSGGDWEISGSDDMGNSRSGEIGGHTSATYYHFGRTYFGYADDDMHCFREGAPYYNYVLRHSTGWAGGVGYDLDGQYVSCSGSVNLQHHTVPVHRNGHDVVDTTTARKIGFAISVAGVHLGATSGYSTDLEMHWSATRGSGIWLCGLWNSPNGTDPGPGTVYANNR